MRLSVWLLGVILIVFFVEVTRAGRNKQQLASDDEEQSPSSDGEAPEESMPILPPGHPPVAKGSKKKCPLRTSVSAVASWGEKLSAFGYALWQTVLSGFSVEEEPKHSRVVLALTCALAAAALLSWRVLAGGASFLFFVVADSNRVTDTMRRTFSRVAKIYNVPWTPDTKRNLPGVGSWKTNYSAKEREGVIGTTSSRDERNLRQALNAYLEDEDPVNRRLTKLPGVEFASDLPADPVTRLFFQNKGSHALYQGSYANPSQTDLDRVELQRRDGHSHLHNYYRTGHKMFSLMTDICFRVIDACEHRKRFVILPATHDTKGIASVLFDHGLIAGFRDFHNDRAFAIELKYFQNNPVITCMEPGSRDVRYEFDISPKQVRSLAHDGPQESHVRIYILRLADGRIVDHLTARSEGQGGRVLLVAY